MQPSTLVPRFGLAALAIMALTLAIRAGTLPADALPLPNRLATADTVIVGKVTAILDKTVKVNNAQYKIAEVSISNALMGAKGATTIRLGFVSIPMGVAIRPSPFQATVGMEGCFFLRKQGDIYVVPLLGFLNKKSPNFEKDIALLKRCVKIMETPDASLKAKDAEERFLAAAMLLAKYRTRKSVNDKSEPIDAGQSKLILRALAAADWTPTTDFMKLSPRMVLYKLPLSKKDGWNPPAGNDAKAFAAYARKWLNDHADTYRIQKFVAKKSE